MEPEISQTVGKHKHCVNCGISVRPDQEYCSDSCKNTFEKMVKRKKQWMWLPYIAIILVLLFYFLIVMN